MPAIATDVPHFSTAEANPEGLTLTVEQLSNVYRAGRWLENARRILGVPIDVDSWVRSPAHNVAVGGVNDSQHLDGGGVDWKARGLTLKEVAQKLSDARTQRTIEPWGQLIYYPYTTGHIHVGIPGRGKLWETLVKLGGEAGGYAKFDLGTFLRGKHKF